MSETTKIMSIAKTDDRIKMGGYEVQTIAKNKMGMNFPALTDADIKKIAGWMAKDKKPAEFGMSFDGKNVKAFARVGSNKFYMYEMMLSEERDMEKREHILTGMVGYSVATSSQADAFRREHPAH